MIDSQGQSALFTALVHAARRVRLIEDIDVIVRGQDALEDLLDLEGKGRDADVECHGSGAGMPHFAKGT